MNHHPQLVRMRFIHAVGVAVALCAVSVAAVAGAAPASSFPATAQRYVLRQSFRAPALMLAEEVRPVDDVHAQPMHSRWTAAHDTDTGRRRVWRSGSVRVTAACGCW